MEPNDSKSLLNIYAVNTCALLKDNALLTLFFLIKNINIILLFLLLRNKVRWFR